MQKYRDTKLVVFLDPPRISEISSDFKIVHVLFFVLGKRESDFKLSSTFHRLHDWRALNCHMFPALRFCQFNLFFPALFFWLGTHLARLPKIFARLMLIGPTGPCFRCVRVSGVVGLSLTIVILVSVRPKEILVNRRS